MPMLSFVVPAYNAEQFLATSLDSIRRQTHGDWDAVVVDDGSTDATATIVSEIASADPRFRLLQQPNGGVAAARNAGARMVMGEWICFLDADDVLHREFAATLLDGLTPEDVAVYCNAHYVDVDGVADTDPRLGDWSRGRAGGGGAGHHLVDRVRMIDGPCVMSPGQMLVRRAAHEALAGFDERLSTAADWDHQLRLGALGTMAFRDVDLFAYRRHASNMSRNTARARVEFQVTRLKATRAVAGSERRRVLRINRHFYAGQSRNHHRVLLRIGAQAVALAYTPGIWRVWAAVVHRRFARVSTADGG